MERVTNLLSQVKTVVNSYSRIEEITGQNFNLFSLLRKEDDEVKLHSKFIAELLNPYGSHSQGSIFLKCFLDILKIKDFESNNASVFIEHFTGVINQDKTKGGNIDILIRSINNKLIKIENKIYAIEQENQLLRYHNYQEKGVLIFLTLNGKESVSHKELLANNIDYMQLSYKDDIVNWLETCIGKSAKTPIVRESIHQYLNLVKKLTQQNKSTQMSEEITRIVTKSKGNFESYIALKNSENEIYEEVIKDTVIPFFLSFATDYNLSIKNIESSLLLEIGRYKGFSFTNDLMQSKGIQLTIQFGSHNNKDVYYGFSFIKENTSVTAFLKEVFNECDKIMEKNCQPNSWWLSHAFIPEYKDWKNVETLYDFKYGNFKNFMRIKLGALLQVFNSVSENFNK